MAWEGLEEANLVKRYVEGSGAAFDELYALLEPRARGYARSKLTRQDADDALQLAFLGLVRGAPRFDPRRGNFWKWWGTILFNAVRKVRSSARPRGGCRRITECADDELLELEAPTQDLDSRIDAEGLIAALEVIPATMHDCLWLACHGYTTREIANESGWPLGTVSSRLRRARELTLLALHRVSRVRGAVASPPPVPDAAITYYQRGG
jgi:RNA polymerase sigma factor (sigma-70 family)